VTSNVRRTSSPMWRSHSCHRKILISQLQLTCFCDNKLWSDALIFVISNPLMVSSRWRTYVANRSVLSHLTFNKLDQTSFKNKVNRDLGYKTFKNTKHQPNMSYSSEEKGLSFWSGLWNVLLVLLYFLKLKSLWYSSLNIYNFVL